MRCSSNVNTPNVWNNEWFYWNTWWIPQNYTNNTSIQSAIICIEREKISDSTSRESICGIMVRSSYDNNQIQLNQTGWFTGHKFIIDDIKLYEITDYFSSSSVLYKGT